MPRTYTWTVHICSATASCEEHVNAPSWQLAREKVMLRLFLPFDLVGWLAEGDDGPDTYGLPMYLPPDGGEPVPLKPRLRVTVSPWRWP